MSDYRSRKTDVYVVDKYVDKNVEKLLMEVQL